MKIRKIPVAGTPLKLWEIYRAFLALWQKDNCGKFVSTLKYFTGKENILFFDSGIAAFFIALESVKSIAPDKKEVILPAYTAPSLVVAVLKAGLRPVLCDVSLTDFNIDLKQLGALISVNTLCIVPVHMFGIPVDNIDKIKDIAKDVIIIEDCAQAMGSSVNGKLVGGFGDISFFSFNRGKNLPTYSGGCLATDLKDVAEKAEFYFSRGAVNHGSTGVFLKIILYSLAVRPYVYGTGYPLISRFKDTKVPDGFQVGPYTDCQASLGLSLLNRFGELTKHRYSNGMFLLDALKNNEGLILPKISEGAYPVFNRLPILVKDSKIIDIVRQGLFNEGIETSRMYLRSLHHIFDLGYQKEYFPGACYLAEHLLTLPAHPILGKSDLLKMAEVINDTVA